MLEVLVGIGEATLEYALVGVIAFGIAYVPSSLLFKYCSEPGTSYANREKKSCQCWRRVGILFNTYR